MNGSALATVVIVILLAVAAYYIATGGQPSRNTATPSDASSAETVLPASSSVY